MTILTERELAFLEHSHIDCTMYELAGSVDASERVAA